MAKSQTAENAPKGQSTPVREVSPIDNTKVKAEGEAAFVGDGPGASLQKTSGLQFEGLGNLEDFPTDVNSLDSTEGAGEWCVVVVDMVSGANGVGFVQGDVRRLSKFITGYTDRDFDRNIVKASVRRLFDFGAIRLATDEEIELAPRNGGRVKIVPNEAPEVSDERAKRIAAEKENKELREALANAGLVAERMTPNAGPQQDIAGSGERTIGADEEDWDLENDKEGNK